jgi:hypothetical protein
MSAVYAGDRKAEPPKLVNRCADCGKFDRWENLELQIDYDMDMGGNVKFRSFLALFSATPREETKRRSSNPAAKKYANQCTAEKNTAGGITYFCLHKPGHDGDHSFAAVPPLAAPASEEHK